MTTRPSAPARDGYLDVLRVVGVVAVVVGHLPEPLVPRAAVYSWHVPLFFLLSGYLLSARRSVIEDARHRVSTLVVPYLSWMVLVTLGLVLLWAGPARSEPSALIWAAWGGRYATSPYSAFWFLSSLFVALVVTRVLRRAGIPMWAQPVIGAALLLAAAAYPVVSKLPLGVGQGLACVLFVQAGMVLRAYGSRLAKAWRAVVGAALLAVGVGLVASGTVAPLDLKVLDAGTPVLSVAAALAISGGAVLLPARVTGPAGAVASTLASVSLAVVLLHPLVILWLELTLHPEPWVAAAATILLCWMVALGLSRTPFARYLGCEIRRSSRSTRGGAPATR